MVALKILKVWYLWILLVCYTLDKPTNSKVLVINYDNFNDTLASNDLVVLHLHRESCIVSDSPAPIFAETSRLINVAYPDMGTVAFGHVDCGHNNDICIRFDVVGCMTKIFAINFGEIYEEYQGERTTLRLYWYVARMLEDPISEYKYSKDLGKFSVKKQKIIAYYVEVSKKEYNVFLKVAKKFRKYCQFFFGHGNINVFWQPGDKSNIAFRQDNVDTNRYDEIFTGNLTDFDELNKWVELKCKRLVKEIEPEHLYELASTYVPFMVLFYNPEYESVIKDFQDIVLEYFINEERDVKFFMTNGLHYLKTLSLLNKYPQDLPLIAMDTLDKTYFLQHYTDMYIPGLLKKFFDDVYDEELMEVYLDDKDKQTYELSSPLRTVTKFLARWHFE